MARSSAAKALGKSMVISPTATASSTHPRSTRCRSATASVTAARTAGYVASHPDVGAQLYAGGVRPLHEHRLGHLADPLDGAEPERGRIVCYAGDRCSIIRDQA